MIIASRGLHSCVTPPAPWLASNQYNMTKLMVCTWLFVHDYMMMLHKTVAPVLLECPSSCWLWGGKSHAGKPPRDKELCLWTSENPEALSTTAARQWVQPTIYVSETGSIPSGNFKCDPSPGSQMTHIHFRLWNPKQRTWLRCVQTPDPYKLRNNTRGSCYVAK